MKEWLSTITAKGQATIPAEIRRLLGVRPHDKIVFVVDGDEVRLAGATSVVERTAGALRTQKPARAAQDLRETAERAMAEETVERDEGPSASARDDG
jgi:AbrB family looped-hinge helix DNA binding protein